jgi:hypothetical protein
MTRIAASALSLLLLAACGGGGSPAPGLPAATNAPGTRSGASASPAPSASAAPTPSSAPSPGSPQVAGCAIFPANNPWNTDISSAPLDPNSSNYMTFMLGDGATFLHPDFGSNLSYGIPYTAVNPPAPVLYAAFSFEYASESDPGPYPIPPSPAIEAGSDAHMLVVDSKTCTLYETFATSLSPSYSAGSGAVFNLNSNALRPDYWTSADAAGLAILPGLARYDETNAGAIDHALRFTVPHTSAGFIHPATHFAATSTAQWAPPMGLRLRLKASFDTSPYHGNALVILTALKRFGLILADNGSYFFISGATDARWNDTDLDQLKSVPASAFEAVNAGPVIH